MLEESNIFCISLLLILYYCLFNCRWNIYTFPIFSCVTKFISLKIGFQLSLQQYCSPSIMCVHVRWHIIHMLKTIASPHHFTYNYCNPATFNWSAHIKHDKSAVMYFCVKGIVPPFYVLSIKFWNRSHSMLLSLFLFTFSLFFLLTLLSFRCVTQWITILIDSKLI